MKKILVGFLVFASLFGVAISVSADTSYTTSYQGGNGTCWDIPVSFGYGSRDYGANNYISRLQQYLGISPTGFFGPLTRGKLQIFQSVHGISPTGFFGPLTRAQLRLLTCGGNSYPTPTPIPTSQLSISYISPSNGAVGTYVTIHGSGFTPTGNIVHFADATAWGTGTYSTDISSPDGQTLTFIVPSSKGMCPPNAYCTLAYWPPYQPGNYPVYVSNANGTSNSVNFQLTSGGGTQSQVPTLSYVSPQSGNVGSQITIIGTGFDSRTYVLIDGGTSGGPLSSSDGTHLTFTIPSYVGAQCNLFTTGSACPMYARVISEGNHLISVVTVNGTSNTVNFNVISGSQSGTPTISSITPQSGVVGSTITLYGSGFTNTGNKIVFGSLGTENSPNYNLSSFDGRTLTFTVPTSNYYACQYTTPSCALAGMQTQPGTYSVSVVNLNGTSNSVSYTVTGGSQNGYLNISSLSPASGYVGTAVTIHGSGFSSSNNTVQFGPATALGTGTNSNNITSYDGTTLTFIVPNSQGDCPVGANCFAYWPPLPAGSYPVTVTNSNGTSNSLNFQLFR